MCDPVSGRIGQSDVREPQAERSCNYGVFSLSVSLLLHLIFSQKGLSLGFEIFHASYQTLNLCSMPGSETL